jgi:anaerobic selenocysteine-containing dehydrogenase
VNGDGKICSTPRSLMHELVCGVCDCITVVREVTATEEVPSFCPMCGTTCDVEEVELDED